jgi:hypothetical protein
MRVRANVGMVEKRLWPFRSYHIYVEALGAKGGAVLCIVDWLIFFGTTGLTPGFKSFPAQRSGVISINAIATNRLVAWSGFGAERDVKVS